MLTKTIEIRDNKALQLLLSLESINFIKIKDSKKSDSKRDFLMSLKPKNTSPKDSFNDLKGIWEKREISAEQIRIKAWPQRK